MRAALLLCAVLLEAGAATPAPVSQRPQPAAPASQDSFLSIDGVRIRYRVEGRGRAVVLLHGFAGRLEDFDGLAAALRVRHRVIRVDLRGFGESGHPHDTSQYGLHVVNDLFAVLDHLGERRSILVGYSLGAAVAAKAAALHPDRVPKLVLIAGGPLSAHSQIMRISDSAAAALEDGRGLRPFLVALTPPGAPVPSDSVMGAVSRQVLSSGDSVAWAAFIRGQSHLVLQPSETRSLTMPTLLLAGTQDPLGAEARDWQPILAHAEFRAIAGATHENVLSRAAVTRDVRAFLLARGGR